MTTLPYQVHSATSAEAAAAFSAGDMERVRLDLCDRYARTRAATLNRQRDEEVARLRAAAIPEDAEEIVAKYAALWMGIAGPLGSASDRLGRVAEFSDLKPETKSAMRGYARELLAEIRGAS